MLKSKETIISELNKELINFVEIDCQLCEHSQGWPVYGDDMGIPDQKVFCSNCGLIYKKKVWTAKDNDTFYNKYYLKLYTGKNNGDVSKEEVFFEHSRRRSVQVKKIKDILEKSKKPLEIGCGSGGVLSELSLINKDTMGVDINKEAIDFAKSKGLNAKCVNIFDMTEKFDFVWSSHMFEHILNIRPFLDKMDEITTKDANIVLIVPNSKKMGEGPHAPHVFNFFQKTFIQLIEKNSNFRFKKKISSVAPEGKDWDLFNLFIKDANAPLTFPEMSTTHKIYKKHMKNVRKTMIWTLRDLYDNSSSNDERRKIVSKYKDLKYPFMSLQVRMIWSILYRTFKRDK